MNSKCWQFSLITTMLLIPSACADPVQSAADGLADTSDGVDGGSNSNGNETGSASQTSLGGSGGDGDAGDGDGDSDPGDGDGDSDPGDGDSDSDPGDGDSGSGDGDGGDGAADADAGADAEAGADADAGADAEAGTDADAGTDAGADAGADADAGGDGDGDGRGDGGGDGDGDGDGGGDGGNLISDTEIQAICDGDYYEFTRPDRNVNHNDGDGNIETCDRTNSNIVDDEWWGYEWYRFTGAAGNRMPEDAPNQHSCGCEAPGWMLGDHPLVDEGVAPRTVCFHWSNDTCQWQADIEVINCGNFYVYHLPNATTCALRYCGVT
jgi:hypothetical protein